jgi:hypothetical protein
MDDFTKVDFCRSSFSPPTSGGSKLFDSGSESFPAGEGGNEAVRKEKEHLQGHGSLMGANYPTLPFPILLQPRCDFFRVGYCGREEQEPYPGGQIDKDLFPYHPPIRIAQIMGFIQDDQISLYADPFMHGIVELVAQNLRCSHDDRGAGILFAIPCQDAAVIGSKFMAEFLIDRIGKGFKRRRIAYHDRIPLER